MRLLSVLGKHRCHVRSHKTIAIAWTHREAPGLKILDRLSVSADICWYISDYRNIGKNPYRCNTTNTSPFYGLSSDSLCANLHHFVYRVRVYEYILHGLSSAVIGASLSAFKYFMKTECHYGRVVLCPPHCW